MDSQRMAMKQLFVSQDFEVAEKSLTVELKKPWNYLAEFNSAPVVTFAAGNKNHLKSEWRCLLDKVRTYFDQNPA